MHTTLKLPRLYDGSKLGINGQQMIKIVILRFDMSQHLHLPLNLNQTLWSSELHAEQMMNCSHVVPCNHMLPWMSMFCDKVCWCPLNIGIYQWAPLKPFLVRWETISWHFAQVAALGPSQAFNELSSLRAFIFSIFTMFNLHILPSSWPSSSHHSCLAEPCHRGVSVLEWRPWSTALTQGVGSKPPPCPEGRWWQRPLDFRPWNGWEGILKRTGNGLQDNNTKGY